jgi:Na+/H+ antiporter NhaA
VLTGSAAAALTGLMFVVITLVMQSDRPTTREGIDVFSTPTVLHFGLALLISAALTAPWPSLVTAAVPVGHAGLCGLTTVARATNRSRRLDSYQPDLEDWVAYTILPFIAYGLIVAGTLALPTHSGTSLFIIAAGVVILMFMGIRNAWDVVTYIAIGIDPSQQGASDEGKES